MKKITLLPLLLTLLSTVAFNSAKNTATKNNPDVKENFQNTNFAVSVPGILKKSEADTIPESEIAKIKSKDIENITFVKDIITIKFKNGDSVISKKEDYVEKLETNASFNDKAILLKGEVESSYPGGPGGWMRHLNSTFRYPDEAVRQRIQGTVVVQFIVDKNGKVSNIEPVSGPTTGGLREETVRVIKNSGKWIPATFYGHPLKSYKKQPITYRLEPR